MLDDDVSCYGNCNARRANWDSNGGEMPCECSIDEPRTVRIDYSSNQAPVWYEYVRAPCIQMAYPEQGSMNTVKVSELNFVCGCC